MLLGLMSLPNEVVYVQFHPVAYMVKLNIEMSMASLITRLATDQRTGFNSVSYSRDPDHRSHPTLGSGNHKGDVGPGGLQRDSIELGSVDEELGKIRGGAPGIHRRLDVEVRIDSMPCNEGRSDDEPSGSSFGKVDDEVSLTDHGGQSTNPTETRLYGSVRG